MEALSGFKHMIPLALAAQRIQDQNSIQCSPRGRSAIQIRAIAERPGQAIDDRTPTTRELGSQGGSGTRQEGIERRDKGAP